MKFRSSARVPRRMLATGGYPFAHNEGRLGDRARVFWRPDWDKSVLLVRTLPAYATENAFDIHLYRGLATVLVLEEGFEVVLLTDGVHHLQLFVLEGTVLNGPVYLRYALSGFRHLETRVMSLRRLVGLHQHGQFVSKLYPAETKAERWVQALRAYDAHATGASQREIALTLFGERATENWSNGSDFMRLRIKRLINYSKSMIAGAYSDLLK
ncbi:DUF2285 domain-containing protein [Asticcacaulis sp. BYS171W]|uniref:DUF2285 domain-containing protein n=1 Tax=Asticcacaulis aquaticus TaxID=2984212 RepID=A0ABT5HQE4_9CAUL|nr:DUF2285 domain-containing protein [Asticcacaulis aquaticus]MDC7682162.1 DUF2285 domain-containing protein [Asticcacaulis aquaticus]